MSDIDDNDDDDGSYIETLNTDDDNNSDDNNSSDNSNDNDNDSDDDDDNDDNDNNDNTVNLDAQPSLDLTPATNNNNNNNNDDDDDVPDDDIDISHIPDYNQLLTDKNNLVMDDLLSYINLYQQKVSSLNTVIDKLRLLKKENVKKHRGSVIDLHNRMFKKLIETETEQKTELQKSQDIIADLEKQLRVYKLKDDQMDAAKNGNLQSISINQIDNLLESEKQLKQQVDQQSNKLKAANDELKIEKMKHEKTHDSHRKSISTLHTNMFKKLLDAEDDFEDKIDKLNEELNETKKLLQQEKMKSSSADKLRRDSISTVHNNMLTKLLDAQNTHDEEREKFTAEIKILKAEIKKYRHQQLTDQANADRQADKQPDNDNNDDDDDDDDDQSDVSDLNDDNNDDDIDDKPASSSNNGKNLTSKDFDNLWGDDDDDPSVEIQRLKAHIHRIEDQLKEEIIKNETIEKQRKDSIHNLHNNMFQKLLDAEFEYEEEIERLHKEKEELNEKIIFYEEHFEKLNKSNTTATAIGIGTVAGGGGSRSAGSAPSINPKVVMDLKDQIKEKDETIELNKQQIFGLTQQISKLELDIENEQKQRRGSVSFLSKQMMDKLLEAEHENDEQKKKYDDKVLQLENALQNSNDTAFKLEKTRRNSLTTVSKAMFQKLLDAEQQKKKIKNDYELKIKELEELLEIEKLKNQTIQSQNQLKQMNDVDRDNKINVLQNKISTLQNDHNQIEKNRRESFSELRNNMWKTLLDAEDDYETQIKKLKKKIINQKKELNKLQKDNEFLIASKLNLINQCNKQMDDLRDAVKVYNKPKKGGGWFGL